MAKAKKGRKTPKKHKKTAAQKKEARKRAARKAARTRAAKKAKRSAAAKKAARARKHGHKKGSSKKGHKKGSKKKSSSKKGHKKGSKKGGKRKGHKKGKRRNKRHPGKPHAASASYSFESSMRAPGVRTGIAVHPASSPRRLPSPAMVSRPFGLLPAPGETVRANPKSGKKGKKSKKKGHKAHAPKGIVKRVARLEKTVRHHGKELQHHKQLLGGLNQLRARVGLKALGS